jgi:hypothetical protein
MIVRLIKKREKKRKKLKKMRIKEKWRELVGEKDLEKRMYQVILEEEMDFMTNIINLTE